MNKFFIWILLSLLIVFALGHGDHGDHHHHDHDHDHDREHIAHQEQYAGEAPAEEIYKEGEEESSSELPQH